MESSKRFKGYSSDFSFDQALKAAVDSLNELLDKADSFKPPKPDELRITHFQISNMGIERGGLKGGSRLFVEIEPKKYTPESKK